MESWIHRLFLMLSGALAAGGLVLASGSAVAADVGDADSQPLIDPELDRRDIKEDRIDTEDFEIGVFGGAMSVEDFGTNFVYGVRGAYHVTEDIFVEAAWGRTDTDETSAERLIPAQILQDSDRRLTYYNLSFGWNVLPGEAFITSQWAFNTALYLIGGVASTDFAGEDQFTWNFGAGLRLLATDWLAVRIDGRDHVFEMDILGESKTTHNLEFTAGVSVFF